MFPSHGAGKGSGDRSPGWREHYDDIDWGVKDIRIVPGTRRIYEPAGFVQVRPGVRRKTYGPSVRPSVDLSDWRKPEEKKWWEDIPSQVETNPF